MSNKERIREYQRQYRLKNRTKRLAQKKEWREKNPERQKERLRACHVNRMTNDPLYKLQRNLRKRLANAVKRDSKSGSAVKDLGCSMVDFKSYLESKFLPNMSWDNYGRKGWHMDHIVPLSHYDLSDPNQLKKACHYTNIQPMWWRDNLSKGSK